MTGAKILIVEDEAITAEVIAEQLEQLGYRVTDTVAAGSVAIASIAKKRPDLVLMDINLRKGDLDGIETAARIREQFQLPVVYLTGNSDRATLERAKITGPFGYIVKPFTEKDLQVAIEMALHNHEMHRQLAEREELLESILNSNKQPVLATDKSGAIAYMNPAAETLTGRTLAESRGLSPVDLFEFLPETIAQQPEHPVKQVLEQGKVLYLDEYVALIAREKPAQTPVQSSEDSTEAVLVMWDAQGKQLPAPSEPASTKPQPTEKEVEQILAAERELSELKSRLITTISHEYRTPLMVVSTSAGLLQRYKGEMLEKKKDQHLEKIQAAIQQMTRLVDDVVTFSKAESNQFKFNPEVIPLESLCRSLVQEQELAASHHCTIDFIYEGTSSNVKLDPQLLRQILTQLLSNAVKYSPPSSRVSLMVSQKPRQGVFSVRDGGIGIPSAEQEKLFEPFFRASNIGNISGTGMGLAIVKKCVDLHRGEITVRSEAGMGTVFTVTLPLLSIS